MSRTLRDVHPTFGHIPINLVVLGQRLGNPAIRAAEMLKILEGMGLPARYIDLVQKARHCCGMRYRHNANRSATPRTFDCSTLVQYLYALAGVDLPRFTHLMVDHGEAIVPPYQPGDLLFTTGRNAWKHHNFPQGIGHVAFATNEKTCVHTDNTGTKRVIEMPIADLQWPIATARRLLPNVWSCNVIILPQKYLWVRTPGEVEAIVRKHLQSHRRPFS